MPLASQYARNGSVPTTDVADVADRLRTLLSADPESRALDSHAMRVLDDLLVRSDGGESVSVME